MSDTDEEQIWVLQSREGNPAAFESLIRAHQPRKLSGLPRRSKAKADHTIATLRASTRQASLNWGAQRKAKNAAPTRRAEV